MPIVQSAGALRTADDVATVEPLSSPRSVFDAATVYTYNAIYATQPAVRTVVDFLARNIAQLPIHAYRRISDLDRERLAGHELVNWLEHPTPATTRYRLLESLVMDLGITFTGYWLKLRGEKRIGLLRLPPGSITVTGWLYPTGFQWRMPDNCTVALTLNDVVYFHGYNPFDPVSGLSPIETLRLALAEDAAARQFRRGYWSNSARLEGVVTRPKDAPKWTPEQKTSWREQWQSRFAGQPGQVAVLEDGMDFKPMSFSARDSEFTEARKLTREEVAAAYHVPQPMVGILDHATFSNIKEQHKQLYQDTLGPWLAWIEEELERQLLPECDDTTDVYLEFNIADKMKGSFEEQADSLYRMVGRPVMTANEGRARLNLPSIKNDPTADQLAMPLNTSPGSTIPVEQQVPSATLPATAPIIARVWDRQRARLAKLDPTERAQAFDVGRWDRELAADLEPIYRAAGYDALAAAHASASLAATVNGETLQLLVLEEDAFSRTREAALYG